MCVYARITIRVCAYRYTRMCVYLYAYVRMRMCVYSYVYVRIIRVCAVNVYLSGTVFQVEVFEAIQHILPTRAGWKFQSLSTYYCTKYGN